MSVALALVHHANQFLITDGYEQREGISDIVDGMFRVLEVHNALRVPLNLHISGTLLEAIAWHSPSSVHRLRQYVHAGLIELVGSSYGQNIMRFFRPDYNRQQLNEELRLYESLLGIDARSIEVFWPPERVWDTRRMAPVLRDATLANGGYRYVVIDDRTLLSPRDAEMPRAVYDKDVPWTDELYRAYEIENGLGLAALPIAIRLRHSIPPKGVEDWLCVKSELESLLVHASEADENNLLALYADDMEKVTGVWGQDGPVKYADFLRWISQSGWIKAVKLSRWLRDNPPAGRRTIENGTFAELACDFEAGENYENWYYSEEWAPYRSYFEMTAERVLQCRDGQADNSLVELAEKQLLVCNWETAWHTPASGAHGDPSDNGSPSPWARATTSHCRHALVTVEAARWMYRRDGRAHAGLADLDHDGEEDVVLKNDRLFCTISHRWGGRVTLLYHLAERGVLVVGNPCDDWNYLEELNRFMHQPRNHPGAFADVGFEEDQYSCTLLEEGGGGAAVRLVNVQEGSKAQGLEKLYRLDAAGSRIVVEYTLPPGLGSISLECALSPDYLSLLRQGSQILDPIDDGRGKGFSASDVEISVEPNSGVKWEKPFQELIGHARTVRLTAQARQFQIGLVARLRGQRQKVA